MLFLLAGQGGGKQVLGRDADGLLVEDGRQEPERDQSGQARPQSAKSGHDHGLMSGCVDNGAVCDA